MSNKEVEDLINEAMEILEEALEKLEDSPPPDGEIVIDEWSGGNLWKPKSDSDGNLVVLLKSSYANQRAEVKRKDGTWEPMRYTGRSNGDRPTFRGTMSGRNYAGLAGSGGVRFTDRGEAFFIPIPGPGRKRYD